MRAKAKEYLHDTGRERAPGDYGLLYLAYVFTAETRIQRFYSSWASHPCSRGVVPTGASRPAARPTATSTTATASPAAVTAAAPATSLAPDSVSISPATSRSCGFAASSISRPSARDSSKSRARPSRACSSRSVAFQSPTTRCGSPARTWSAYGGTGATGTPSPARTSTREPFAAKAWPCQELRAEAARLIEWFHVLLREGWLGSRRRSAETDPTSISGEKRLSSILAARDRHGVNLPYGRYAVAAGFAAGPDPPGS